MKIMSYDWDKKENVQIAEVGIRDIATSLTDDEFAELIERRMNMGMGGRPAGEYLGAKVVGFHRTLQGQFIEFVIGMITGYRKQYVKVYRDMTDPRNEGAVQAATRLTEVIEADNLHQLFI